MVKQMKAHGQTAAGVDYKDLLGYIKQMQFKFVPQDLMINQARDYLLDEKYIERNPNSRTRFNYVP